MESCKNRHVCVSDLINYLKRNSYLDGYSKVEQEQIRFNIGAAGKKDIQDLIQSLENLYISTTYENLTKLVQEQSLKIGHLYAINDFNTIYQSNDGEVLISDNNYVLVLMATGNNIFHSRVVLLSDKYLDSYKWIVEYDFESKVLNDTPTKGTITYLEDTNGNSAYYDFKSIKFKRTKEELQLLGITIEEPFKYLYTFNDSDFQENSESTNVTNNQFDFNCYNNVFITSICSNNSFKSGFWNNSFTGECKNNQFQFDTKNNLFKDDVYLVNGSVQNIQFINKNYTNSQISKTLIKTITGYAIIYVDIDTLTTQITKL